MRIDYQELGELKTYHGNKIMELISVSLVAIKTRQSVAVRYIALVFPEKKISAMSSSRAKRGK